MFDQFFNKENFKTKIADLKNEKIHGAETLQWLFRELLKKLEEIDSKIGILEKRVPR